MQAQRFAARWSPSVWIITLAVIVLVVFVMGGMIRTAKQNPDTVEAWLLVAGALVLPIVLCVAVLFAPLAYGVVPEGIVIRRIGRSLAIGFEQIGEIRRIDSKEIGLVIRVFGSGGFFGWFGRFYGRHLGWFTAWSSSGSDLVLIRLVDETRIVISPHPADGFLEAVRRARSASP